MNVTPPTSGAGNAHSITNAQAANSSPANFLLADSPGNSDQDFRAIAAALFGADSSTSNHTQLPGKKLSTPSKATSRLQQDEPATRKSNQSPDSNAAPVYPGLTGPLLDVPKPSLDVGPLLAESAKLPSQTKSENGNVPVAAVSTLPSETPDKIASLSSSKEPIVEGQALDEGNIGNGVKFAKEAPLQVSSASAPGTPAKKLAPDASRLSAVIEPAKLAATQTLPSAARSNASPAQQPPTAIDATASAAVVAQISVATAPEILKSSMAAKIALQSGSIQSGLTAESKNVSGRDTSAAASKSKDRDTKDTKTDPTRSTKFASAEETNGESGLTKAVAADSKDNAGAVLTTHSDAHAKSSPLKQAAGPAIPTTAADADGPDEALPTSASSPVTAKFVQGMSQSEFRVGMQTQEFGNIDIRTSVARHMFSAQISVEHGDMAKSMTADLPALYHKLADQQVTVGSIVIQGQNLATSSGLAHDAQPQSWHRPQVQQGTSPETKTIVPLTMEVVESAGRLDIRI